MKLLAVAIGALIAAQPSTGAAQEFDPDAEVQAPALESKWPPIDEPSFRTSFLDHLLRHTSLRTNSGKDVMPDLSTSIGRFCNLPAGERSGFVLFEFADFANGTSAEKRARRRLRKDCGLAIYAWEQDGTRSFVAIYSRPRGTQPTGQAYTVQQDSGRMRVIALPVPTNSLARFRTAARREAFTAWGAPAPR